MSSRISIYDINGIKLTEIDASFSRTWMLNRYGTGDFTISVTDPKATQENLRFGNLITAEHEKLPIWGGIIDTPRTWMPGAIKVSCYSAAYILTSRVLDLSTLRGTAGAIFEKIISHANSRTHTLFSLGEVYQGGVANEFLKYGVTVYAIMQAMEEENGHDWSVIPENTNTGNLSFECNWYEKRGMIREIGLIEDKNVLIGGNLVEQGKIVNALLVYGSGATWATKPHAIATDSNSPYGLKEALFFISELTHEEAQDKADTLLKKYKNPRKTFSLTALDDTITPANSIFYNIRIGDTIPVDLHTTGFTEGGFGLTTKVRILGMGYNDLDNQLSLVCDEEIL